MSEHDPFRVYVAHLFQQSDDYRRIFEYLESNDRFFYQNSSNPDSMPASGGTESIQAELRNQIDPAEIVILPLTLHTTNPTLIDYQISYSQAAKKPILGVQPFGNTVSVDKSVLGRCDDIVEWNERSIISGIKRLARDEAVADWDLIEFEME